MQELDNLAMVKIDVSSKDRPRTENGTKAKPNRARVMLKVTEKLLDVADLSSMGLASENWVIEEGAVSTTTTSTPIGA